MGPVLPCVARCSCWLLGASQMVTLVFVYSESKMAAFDAKIAFVFGIFLIVEATQAASKDKKDLQIIIEVSI